MSALVAAARKYLGVPFGHRGRSRARLDCAGLVILSYADCGIAIDDIKIYGREPLDESLPRYATGALGDPLPCDAKMQPGDVVLIKFDGLPHHVAILGDYPFGDHLSLIHADSREKRVVEHRLTEEKITHAYRRPV